MLHISRRHSTDGLGAQHSCSSIDIHKHQLKGPSERGPAGCLFIVKGDWDKVFARTNANSPELIFLYPLTPRDGTSSCHPFNSAF